MLKDHRIEKLQLIFPLYFLVQLERKKNQKNRKENYLKKKVPLASASRSRLIPAGGDSWLPAH